MRNLIQIVLAISFLSSCELEKNEEKDETKLIKTESTISNVPNYYLCKCTCTHINIQNGSNEIIIDTLVAKNIQEAELECSNYETTDDSEELINCQIVKN